ncbi:MAG: Uma2 family endonuclease [Verrucomicrobiaceae bacterium]|nr:Uma2 family endonuclease [Verrucomicrobiaceae bacterium]
MPASLELTTFRERQIPLCVDAYHVLGDMGFIPETTELLEGIVIKKMPKSPLHNYIVFWLANALRAFAGAKLLVREEKPLEVDGFSEPEPDIAVVEGDASDFLRSNPETARVVIEVSCSSLAADQSKAVLYAKAGVPEYWIVRAEERVIEIRSCPEGTEYRETRIVSAENEFVSKALPGFVLDWSRLFPR